MKGRETIAILDDEETYRTTRRRLLQGAAGLLATSGLWSCAPAPEEAAVTSAALGGGDALPDDLWRAGAHRLASAIARREVSSAEVVDAFLARIEAVNPLVNAVIAVYPDEARAAAAAADRAVAAGEQLGPLHGVPFTIKDNLDQAGKPNTNGIVENRDNIAEHDHPTVARMKAAGGIPIGRTNLPDLALRVHSYSELWGRTLNPWDPERNVGGSSGGEGSALASGMTPIGLGNDIGGSLRNPANCCGIVSLKPSLGRIPGTGPSDIASQLMAVEGPMARHVEDLRLGYEILAGRYVGDPWTVPVPLDLDPPAERRVALVPEPAGGETDASVAEAVRRAGNALAAAGWQVEEVQPPRLPDVAATWMDWLGVELDAGMGYFEDVMSPEAFRFLDLFMQSWHSGGLEMYMDAMRRRHTHLVEWTRFFQTYPLLVGPVFTRPPFRIGYDVAGKDEAWDVIVQLRLVVAANLMGLPAVAVPVGIGDDGLPRGVQVMGESLRDDLCLEGAAAIEAAMGTFTPIDPRT